MNQQAMPQTEAQLAVAGLTARFCAGRRWPRRARWGAERRESLGPEMGPCTWGYMGI